MYARMSETLLLPHTLSQELPVTSLLRDSAVEIALVDLRGEAVYTVAKGAPEGRVVGWGFVPEPEDRFPEGVILVLQANAGYEYRLDLHHWSSDDFHGG